MGELDRGDSSSQMRRFRCKDCQREHDALVRERNRLKRRRANPDRIRKLTEQIAALRERQAVYNEASAIAQTERGGSRSDRCKEHRDQHRNHIQGIAVAYIDLRTVGEVRDRKNPTGPLGGLGRLPDRHEFVPNTSYPLQDVNVGMTDAHIVEMVRLLRDKRVLILKAGTGTGKSTFAPYRLLDPPPGSLVDVPPTAPFAKLSELGQIVVTEPRVQATIGVAEFVGGVMSGAGGVGPGFPVGYQVSGDRNHDEACQLVYVTDGTMINWLREGRLSRIGTVIVDEAHERSTNIDFILGYLKRELDRYPHLRVIVTSATFNTKFYQEYFGGEAAANVMDVPAAKTFGYGMPMFPNLDVPEAGEDDVLARWDDEALPLTSAHRGDQAFIERHWPEQFAPALGRDDVVKAADEGYVEDVWKTTRSLLDLRYDGSIPIDRWREQMPEELAKFVVRLAKGLDDAGIYGDILGFLPTTRTIEPACEQIELALGQRYRGHVFPLISTLPKDRQIKALAKRRMGDRRKIVISTNLAETSLTVEGVRFVVDSGLIAQSEWDPVLAKGGIPTKSHSRAGIKQRWGRVGRKAPGWVFPLYTKGQFLSLAEDTPPGSTRENLEALVMTAKLGGIDDVVDFPWPAAFAPETVTLDETAQQARSTFRRELRRADAALQESGAVDQEGHPTPFGKELARFQGLGSAASALAILYADKLACVPEVVAILSLLEDTRLIGERGLLLDDRNWPDEWRLEAAERHRGLATLCEDDAHLVILLFAAWERADPDVVPWEPSRLRRDWARRWWVNDDVLLEAAAKRRDVLAALSPAMKEEVRRFIEPALLDRARGVITRAFGPHVYRRLDDSSYVSVTVAPSAALDQDQVDVDPLEHTDTRNHANAPDEVVAGLEDDAVVRQGTDAVVALRRREAKDDNRISNLVAVQPWAIPASGDGAERVATGDREAMRLVVEAARHAGPDLSKEVALHMMDAWPVGQRILLRAPGNGRIGEVLGTIAPFARPRNESELDAEERRRIKRPRRGRTGFRRADIDDDEPDGNRADSDYDLNPHRGRRGYRDEAEIAASEFQRADVEIERGQPCGFCDACAAGREQDCENPIGRPDRDTDEDSLREWLDRARAGVDVSNPNVSIDGEPTQGEAWYEVVGYTIDEDWPGVELRRDWRPDGFTGTPAEHVGVEAGQAIEVIVGAMTRHHGGELRIFDRVDQQGRFVVREASTSDGKRQEQRSEIAVSLHRGARGLLAELVEGAQLTATVVPARVEGCYSITLLELLHQHLKKAAGGHGVEYHELDTASRNASRATLYQAVVESTVNEHGYVTFVLLIQDPGRGIRHRFDLRVEQDERWNLDDDAEENDAAATPEGGTQAATGLLAEPLEVGAPVLLNLDRDHAHLPVGGLDLNVLEEIVGESSRELRLFGDNAEQRSSSDRGRRSQRDDRGEVADKRFHADVDDDEQVGSDEDDELAEPRRRAPADAELVSLSEEPLSRSAARKLCELDTSAEWQNEVWAFWARSHHRRISRRNPGVPGSSTEVIDVVASVRILDTSPLEEKRRKVTAFAERHPVGTDVPATVDQIKDGGVFVRLDGGVEGWIPVAELSWDFTDHASEDVRLGEEVDAEVTRIDLDQPWIELSPRAISGREHLAERERIVAEAWALAESTDWQDGAAGFKKLTDQMTAAGPVLKNDADRLWGELRAAKDQFFARRNAQARGLKEQLIASAEALVGAADVIGALAEARALSDRWKKAPRTSREEEDELWARFRSAQDVLYARRNEAARLAKEGLIARARSLAASAFHSPADWKAASSQQSALMDDWKAAGSAGNDDDALFAHFKAARKDFFDRLDGYRNANQAGKAQIVARAEYIAELSDWKAVSAEFRQLRDYWKGWGPAPRDAEDALWKRFKGAQDRFYARQQAHFGR